MGITHRQTPYPALRSVLGDEHLLRRIPVCLAVRREFLRQGYGFTKQDFCGYEAAPFKALPGMLEKKKVVFFENSSNGRRNFLLHETSHCIAHGVFFDGCSIPRRRRLARSWIFGIFAAEAFANATEMMASWQAKSKLDKKMLSFNSYRSHDSKADLYRDVAQEYGERVAFRLCFFGFLLNMFFVNKISDALIKRVAKLSGLSVKSTPRFRAGIRRILQSASINAQFRITTSNEYLNLLGDHRHVFEAVDFDAISFFERHSEFRKKLNVLEKVVCAR